MTNACRREWSVNEFGNWVCVDARGMLLATVYPFNPRAWPGVWRVSVHVHPDDIHIIKEGGYDVHYLMDCAEAVLDSLGHVHAG